MFSLLQLTDMTFVFCSSGLIFFFVRTNVELHPVSESLPLLIDRVSALIRGCFFFATSFSGSQSWRHTQSLLKCTNSLSGRIWRNMDFLSVCWLCLALSCLFSWCQCFERWRDFTSGCCSSLQRMNSGSYGPASPECWIEVIGPKTRRFMWAQILSMQATKKGRFMKNVF